MKDLRHLKNMIDIALLNEKPFLALNELKDTEGFKSLLPELYEMDLALHDEKHHPEGNPWVHTLLVVDEVRKRTTDIGTLWGALLHDVGKPSTQEVVESKITNYGHDVVGERIAEEILLRLGVSKLLHEKVKFIVRHHMRIKTISEMKKSKREELKSSTYFSSLLTVAYCDSLVSGSKDVEWADGLAID